MNQYQSETEKSDRRESLDRSDNSTASLTHTATSIAASMIVEDVVKEEKPRNTDDPESTSSSEEIVDPNIVYWDGPDDPDNPLNWSIWLRMAHIAFASLSCLMVNLASTMYAPATALVMKDFSITNSTLGSFTVTMYLLGFAVGPMVIAPLSELYGRRLIYHISGLMFVVCNVGCALSNGVGMLFVFRFLAGCAGSAPQTVGGGTISDVVPLERRGAAMAIFGLGPLFGPVIGPIAGAFESSAIGWRWIFWTLAIAMGLVTGISLPFMRETYPVVLINNKAARLRKETGNQDLKSKYDLGVAPGPLMRHSIERPMKMLIFSPIVLLMSLYMSFIVGLTFLFFTTFPQVFEQQYGFSAKIVGLVYIGMGIGQLVALIIFGKWSDLIQQRLTIKRGARPENRLPLMIIFSPTVIIGLFMYGWGAQAKVHWIVPIIGTSFCGFGSFFVIMPVFSYLLDTYPMYAASAFAANTLIRSLFSCFFPLVAPSLYAALDYGWGNSLLAFITMLFLPVPFLFYKYGEQLREKFPLNL